MAIAEKKYLDPEEAGKRFPKPLNKRQVRHRMRNGIRGVYLKYVSDGKRMLTTEQWIQEFIAQVTGPRPMPAIAFYEDPHVAFERLLRL